MFNIFDTVTGQYVLPRAYRYITTAKEKAMGKLAYIALPKPKGGFSKMRPVPWDQQSRFECHRVGHMRIDQEVY